MDKRLENQPPGEDDADPLTATGTDTRTVAINVFSRRDDVDAAAALLRSFGFHVEMMDDGNLPAHAPDLVMLEIDADGRMPPGCEMLDEHFGEALGPKIALATEDSIHTRLAGVRVGCAAFLPLPLDGNKTVDTVDRLTGLGDESPARVMIVDDDAVTAAYAEIILKKTGMIVETLTDPTMALDRAADFAPELMLIDLYMPQCSGIELAAVVRQNEQYAGIPIVFLSGEKDIDAQLCAMGEGGDDFLTKPILAHHLIAAVRTKVRRFRALRNRMMRDSLTDLYNHTTTKQFLDTQIAGAVRNGRSLSYAIVDIDHFKNVNDTYGHGVGDMVIKSLARLLRQRLRGADVVGRMGGEEFGVILVDADEASARSVMEALREAFSEVRHVAGEVQLQATFSCGIATLNDMSDAKALAEAADRALYDAKRGGRNQVVVAGD